MMLILKLWLGWHVLLALVALIQRAPVYQCVRIRGAMRVREFLRSRAWVSINGDDAWIGAYWKRKTSQLFIVFFPGIVLRLEIHVKPSDRLQAVWRALQEDRRSHGLTTAELQAEVLEHVVKKFPYDSREASLISEAANRLGRLRGGEL
jgi:hypothetical protein